MNRIWTITSTKMQMVKMWPCFSKNKIYKTLRMRKLRTSSITFGKSKLRISNRRNKGMKRTSGGIKKSRSWRGKDWGRRNG